MRSDFKFYNLLGTVYRQGNVVFTPDGTKLLSPVGNKIAVYDLSNNKTCTLGFQTSQPITHLEISRNGKRLLVVDQDNFISLLSLPKGVMLTRTRSKDKILNVSFHPSTRFFSAVTASNLLIFTLTQSDTLVYGGMRKIWHTPVVSMSSNVNYASFSPCGNYLCCSSTHNNLSAIYRVGQVIHNALLAVKTDDDSYDEFSKTEEELFKKKPKITFANSGGRPVVKAFFGRTFREFFTLDDRGKLNVWHVAGPNMYHIKHQRVIPNTNRDTITSADFIADLDLLVVGFASGIFTVLKVTTTDFEVLKSLRISNASIGSCAINKYGDWLALGCPDLGQLLVWDWKSETYILKQQGHGFNQMTCATYSPDGTNIATGGEDGKIKVWDGRGGSCFVTFAEHKAKITQLIFSRSNAVFSASVDGTIRAFDLTRFRNFRTFTAPKPTQFTCLCLDEGGEILAAGSKDTFEVYVWNVKTAKLLDVLAAHEAPVSALQFSPISNVLVTGSWDKTVRVWDVFEGKGSIESLAHTSDVITLAHQPNSRQLCVSTIDGQLTFWNLDDSEQTGSIAGARDIRGSLTATERSTTKNSRYFTCLSFSGDGSLLIAAGNSKFVCVYSTEQKVLLRRLQITRDFSIEGIRDFIAKDAITDAGLASRINDDSDSDDEFFRSQSHVQARQRRDEQWLPGTREGKKVQRTLTHPIRIQDIQFSPTNRDFLAVSNEGLTIYSMDQSESFDPVDLDISVTPDSIQEAVKSRNYQLALVMAFKLNEAAIIREVFNSTPVKDVMPVVQGIPINYIHRVVEFIANEVESSIHIEFGLEWANALLLAHGRHLSQNRPQHLVALRALLKSLTFQYSTLAKMSEDNKYTLAFLVAQRKHTLKQESVDSSFPGMEVDGQKMDSASEESDNDNDNDVVFAGNYESDSDSDSAANTSNKKIKVESESESGSDSSEGTSKLKKAAKPQLQIDASSLPNLKRRGNKKQRLQKRK